MRCVLVGNYGVSNVGDEALKDYFLQAFPEHEWLVLSADPKPTEYDRLPTGFRSLLQSRWGRTLKTLRSSDVVVFGGGSLFTDVESVAACWIWFVHAFVSWAFRKPYFLTFQGIGPLRTSIGKLLTVWVVRHAAFVSVRDEKSAERVEHFLKNKKCIRTFDPVVLLMKKENLERTKNKISLIPRHNSGTVFAEAVKNISSIHTSSEFSVVLMQPDDPQEMQVANDIKKQIGEGATIVSVRSLTVLASCVAQSELVLSERYHGALAALALGVPVQIVSQSAGDKLSTLQPYANGTSSFQEAITAAQSGEEALRTAFSMI